MIERDYFPEAYWVNTSSNAIVKNLIYYADEEQKNLRIDKKAEASSKINL